MRSLNCQEFYAFLIHFIIPLTEIYGSYDRKSPGLQMVNKENKENVRHTSFFFDFQNFWVFFRLNSWMGNIEAASGE